MNWNWKQLVSCTALAGIFNIAMADPALMIAPVDSAGSMTAESPAGDREKVSIGQNTGIAFGTARAFNIDFLAEEGKDVAAITFFLEIQGNAELDLSDCLANLPSTHTGACKQTGDQVRVVVFSMSNAPIPTGRIGSIRSRSGPASISVKNPSFSDPDGSAVSADVL